MNSRGNIFAKLCRNKSLVYNMAFTVLVTDGCSETLTKHEYNLHLIYYIFSLNWKYFINVFNSMLGHKPNNTQVVISQLST